MLQAEKGFVTEITFVWSIFVVHHFLFSKKKREYNYLGKEVDLYEAYLYHFSNWTREKLQNWK